MDYAIEKRIIRRSRDFIRREICLPNHTVCDLTGTQSMEWKHGKISDTGPADPRGGQKRS